jgi:hypothetical protein
MSILQLDADFSFGHSHCCARPKQHRRPIQNGAPIG